MSAKARGGPNKGISHDLTRADHGALVSWADAKRLMRRLRLRVFSTVRAKPLS